MHELEGIPWEKRTARFHCVMVYLESPQDPMPLIAKGTWQGQIQLNPSGKNGFGYDSVFFVPTHDCSAAELSLQEKNKLSHRGQALRELVRLLQTRKK